MKKLIFVLVYCLPLWLSPFSTSAQMVLSKTWVYGRIDRVETYNRSLPDIACQRWDQRRHELVMMKLSANLLGSQMKGTEFWSGVKKRMPVQMTKLCGGSVNNYSQWDPWRPDCRVGFNRVGFRKDLKGDCYAVNTLLNCRRRMYYNKNPPYPWNWKLDAAQWWSNAKTASSATSSTAAQKFCSKYWQFNRST